MMQGEQSAMLQRTQNVVWLLVGAVVFLSYGYTEMAGSDMWWHVAAGRELLQTGTIWMVDDWSYSAAGHDWLNHEWFADVLYWLWVDAFGVASLVYWKWLVVIATFLLLQIALWRQTGNAAAATICAGLAAAIAGPFIDVRPHLYTLLMFAGLIALLLQRRQPLWLLAGYFVLWVNLHGGFFFGLMALGILIFPWRNLSVESFKGALLTGLVCAAVCFLNPAGLETFLYPLKYAFDETSPYKQLAEWLSPFEPGGIVSPLYFIFMWAPLVTLAYLFPWVRRQTGVPWEGIALTGLTLAMSLTSRRFITIYAISLALLLAPLVALILRRLWFKGAGWALAAIVAVFGIVRMQPYPLASAPAFHYLTAEYSYPQELLNYVEVNGLSGNVYALYNWGGYIHWRTDGVLKVFIDGRADTIYSGENYQQYVSVLRGEPGWLQSVEATGAEFFMWPNQRYGGQAKLKAFQESGRWRPVYRDATGYLLARIDKALPPTVLQTPVTALKRLSVAQMAQGSGDHKRAIAIGNTVLEEMPYQLLACNLIAHSYRSLNQADSAEQTLAQCRDQFPSNYLR